MTKTIRDAMTENPRSVELSDPIVDAARMMRDENVGSLPVVDQGRLVGMITDRDITTRAVAGGTDVQSALVKDFCSADPVVVDSNATLDEALLLMARNSLRRLPVVDDARLVGILAQADVAIEGEEGKTGELVQAISEAPESERR
ncbi:MAG: CBS domain-containing protein [Gaiellaceae bacterium]